MTYPKLSELKATKGLSANDLSIKTSIYITGGFLDKAFCDVLGHYLKTVKIFPEIIFDHWKPTWRSIYSPRHFENIEAAEVIVIPLSMHELTDGIKNISTVVDSIKKLMLNLNEFNSKTIFFLIDKRLSLGLTIPKVEYKNYKDYLTILNEIELKIDNQNKFLIPISSLSLKCETNAYSDWISYGFPCSLNEQAISAKIIASTLASKFGLGKKLLAIDFDETLSPGILGEKEDFKNVSLDLGKPLDRFFFNFQIYIKSLKKLGFTLALLSKNNPEAINFIFNGDGNFLSKSDFAGICLSWEPKHYSLKKVCDQLNINPNDAIFIDNSTFEVNQMALAYPGINTICLGEDPSQFLEICNENIWMCSLYEDEDSDSRLKSYKANQNFGETKSSLTNTKATLSIPIQISLNHIKEKDITRVIQLINKTNQFNLSGKKFSTADLEKIDFKIVSRMRDEFTDYGLTSVILGNINNDSLDIIQWVLSCRTFNRNYEIKIISEIAEDFIPKNISKINLIYKKTDRNGYLMNFIQSDDFKSIKNTFRKKNILFNFKRIQI